MVKRKIKFDSSTDEEKYIPKKPKLETLPPINSIDDLIEIGSSSKFYKNINVLMLWDILPHLIELKNMIGMKSVKESIFFQIIYYLQGMHLRNKDGDYLHCIITGLPGSGKCLALNTPLIMYDGSIKLVQDVKVGDLLMGDDSSARTVLNLGRGRDIMYKITNQKNESYTVNSEHILSLYYSGCNSIRERKDRQSYSVKWFNNNELKLNTKDFSYKTKIKEEVFFEAQQFKDSLKNDLRVDISVQDYLKLSKSIKNKMKGYKVPIEFPEKDLPFDPYMIGYWLGDGGSRGAIISCQDSTVLHYFNKNLVKYNLYLNYKDQYDYTIRGYSGLVDSNILLNTLKDLNLKNNKHIPDIYKFNSRENRLKLLAGLLDSDGHLSSGGIFEFTQKNEVLMNDVVYIVRSLGFACYKKEKNTSWTYKGVKNYGKAFRIHISGEGIEQIPTIIPRKRADPRKQIKNVLVSGIKVDKLEEDDYYGFELDGNHRFLLGDFTVSHNTSLAHIISKIYQKLGILSKNSKFKLAHREDFVGEYLGQTAAKTKKLLTSCLGGVIFVDEIYAMSSGRTDKDSYAKEAIDTINAFLSEHKNDFVFIGAGYKDEIEKCFFGMNEGLRRRFAWGHHIEKYAEEELAEIIKKMIHESNWEISVDTTFLKNMIIKEKDLFKDAGGSCENLFSKIKLAHSKRIFGKSSNLKFKISEEDINDAIEMMKKYNSDKKPKVNYDYYT